jgi:carnitine O-acetyltransferase
VLEFRDFGKKLITANNLSPDSFVQQAIMVAYYKLYGKVVCTYEPVLTKQFYHGRTEAMRSATPQAKKLCQVWFNKKSSKHDKLDALRRATFEHSRQVTECSCGYGVDRHLYSLKCIARRIGINTPAFFESEAWKALNHTVLSTSNCGNPALRLFGFGPVVADGFGIGYIIKDYGLSFSVSSKHRQTRRYVLSLQNTLHEMQELLTLPSTISVHHRTSLRETQQHHVHHAPVTYDDFYGESTAIPTPVIRPMATVHENEPKHQHENFKPLRKRASKYYKGVQERSQSFDFLDASDIQIDVELTDDESRSSYARSVSMGL